MMQSFEINLPFALSCLVLVGINLSQPAYAEKADKDKPIILEAEKVFGNDTTQVYDLNGEILLVKGSIVVTGEGYEFIDVKGTPEAIATFRQRREGLANEFMQGLGSHATYDAKTELLTLTGNATLKRLLNMQLIDQLYGWKIEYDDVKQYYRVIPPKDAKPEDLPVARAILTPKRKVLLAK
jgi:lipopolysaccharide export system protein LptA